MFTIGIELNHVVRNVNKQIVKYYRKDINPSLDEEEVDLKGDIFKYDVKFASKADKYNFIYIDYPYEIFGCAPTMEKGLAVKITNWLTSIEDMEDEDIRIIFFSLDEEAITIQSTYFFLSKIGSRVRKMIFPRTIAEVWDECDAVITARREFIMPQKKKVVLIERGFNEDLKNVADLHYQDLSNVIEDKDFFKKILSK